MSLSPKRARVFDPRVFLALAVLILLFFLPAATLQGVYFFGDAQDYLSRLAYSAARLRMGEFALWNPYLSMGGTQIGDPAGMASYVPALLLFILLPAPIALNYTIILHALLAACGMYLLAASWSQSRAAAFLAAIVFCLNGFLVAHLQHLNIFVGIAWLPWLVLCIERYFQTRRLIYFVLGGIVLALQILGGHTQIVLYSGIIWGTYALVCLIRIRSAGRREILISLGGLALMLVCALGLAAIYLVPFVELLNAQGRIGTPDYAFATILSLEPARLVSLIYPYFLGGNLGAPERGPGFLVEMSPYIGILPLTLAVFAFTRPTWRIWFLGALVLIGILLAFGGNTPLYTLVYRLPLFGTVRAPARFLLLFIFAAPLLAAFGLTALRQSPRNIRAAWIFTFALLLITILSLALFALPNFASLPRTIDRAFTNPAFPIACAIIASTTLLWFLWTRQLFSERVRLTLTLSLVFCDLAFYSYNFTYDQLVPLTVYSEPTPNITPLLSDTTASRVFYWTRGDSEQPNQVEILRRLEQSGHMDEYLQVSRAGVRNSLPMRFGLLSMQSYKSETPWQTPIYNLVDVWDNPTTDRLKLIGMFGAKYWLSTRELNSPLLKPIARDTVITYQNALALPRAYVVPQARITPDLDQTIAEMSRPAFDPKQTVLLQSAPPSTAPTNPTAAAPAALQWQTDQPEHITLNVTTSAPAYLVLNDTYYPGWHAYIDTIETPIYRANVLARAIALPAGTHRVEFIYRPTSVKTGINISGLTLTAIIAFLALHFWRSRAGKE